MTPDMQQARAVAPRGDDPPYPAGGPFPGDTPGPPASVHGRGDRITPATHGRKRSAGRAGDDRSIVRAVPYLAVLLVTIAGVYIAWRQGSKGGGDGGVVSGAALLAAAGIRLLVPARLAGLLATRKRATDVVTLAVFGVGLLVAGLVLPG
jgi:DUF3017 family protein